MFHHVKLPACCEPPATDPALLEDVDLLDLEAHVALQHDAMARGDALHDDLRYGRGRMPWESLKNPFHRSGDPGSAQGE